MSVYSGPEIVNNGLIRCYDAGNTKSYPGTGTTWVDLSENVVNATVVGSPLFASYYFDSTSDSNYFTTSSISHRTGDFTYSMWMTIDTVDSSSTLFENGSWTDTLLFRHETSVISVYAEGALYGSFSFTPVAGAWYNIVFKRESSVAYAYVNGTQIGSSFSLSVDINLSNQNLWLMRSQHTTGQSNDGKISIFKIYNRALSLQEINQNFYALRGRFSV